MWKTMRIILLYMFPFFLLLCGCPYESEVPLSNSSEAKIDHELIGKWEYQDPEGEERNIIEISQFNAHELVILIMDEDRRAIELLRAFITIIEGKKFLNIHKIMPEDKKRSWTFVNYFVVNDSLSLKVVQDTLFKKKFILSESVREFVRENMEDKALFSPEGVRGKLKRVRNEP